MSKIKLAGFTRKGSERITVTAKIDSAVMDDLKALEERAAKDAPDYDINRQLVIEEAFREFIRSGNAALDKLAADKTQKTAEKKSANKGAAE